MKTDRINFQHTCFKSKFITNNILEQTFNRAARENDRIFAQSVKTLLNDGKEDTIELKHRNRDNLSLYVNDKLTDEKGIYLNYYGNVGTELINKYVFKESMTKYNNLSEQEKKLVQEDIDLIRLLSENFQSGSNFIDDIQKTLSDIRKKIDDNTKKELEELKFLIFGK